MEPTILFLVMMVGAGAWVAWYRWPEGWRLVPTRSASWFAVVVGLVSLIMLWTANK